MEARRAVVGRKEEEQEQQWEVAECLRAELVGLERRNSEAFDCWGT